MRDDADPHPASVEVAGQSAAALSAMLDAGDISAVAIASQLVERIEALDARGPALGSVLEIAPDALDVAAERDAERRAGRVRGPLHGIPVLVKDNIDTAAPLHTTAGSLVFGESAPPADATLVAALRAAGAIVLGKTNLSEWANFRGRPSSSGWSAAGGQTRNPHVLDRSPGGSSAGSGAAVAARLAPLAMGTETDGSIICPAAACGVAGLKPTVGLVSRTGIVPISWSQDTAGPMARNVGDVALLLEVLCRATDDGEDPTARRARRPAGYQTDFSARLGDGSLSGVRVGVVRDEHALGHPPADAVFESALEALAATGARMVDPVPALPGDAELSERELTVLTYEFGIGARAYFERRAARSPDPSELPHSLDDVTAHARALPEERADLFAIDLLERDARGTRRRRARGPGHATRVADRPPARRPSRDGRMVGLGGGGLSLGHVADGIGPGVAGRPRASRPSVVRGTPPTGDARARGRARRDTHHAGARLRPERRPVRLIRGAPIRGAQHGVRRRHATVGRSPSHVRPPYDVRVLSQETAGA